MGFECPFSQLYQGWQLLFHAMRTQLAVEIKVISSTASLDHFGHSVPSSPSMDYHLA